jgi:hypothetical protein
MPSEVPVITPDHSARLQQVADYRTVHKTLRTSATISVVLGAITVLLALVPPFSVVALVLGLVLLGAGVWNLARPRPTGILVDGASIILVGLSNIVGAVLDLQAGSGGSGFWVKVGVFQLIFGGQAFWRYAQFRDAFRSPASDTELRQLDGMVTAMWKSKVKESTDLIEFMVDGFHATPWKARLTDSVAILATDGGREVKVAARGEIDIAERGKVLIGKSLKATITLRGKTLKGNIPPESYERFQQWKTGVVIPRAIAA